MKIEQLTSDSAHELYDFWRASIPAIPINKSLLAERVFGPPDASPERTLCMRDDAGRLIAVSAVVPPADAVPPNEPRGGGLRLFAVHPEARGRGFGRELMRASLAVLAQSGADAADFLATPPYYIQPGVDTRETGLIAWLLRLGFEHTRTNFNMTADLVSYHPPSENEIFGEDSNGYAVRRAAEKDLDAFGEYCTRLWTTNWGREASQGVRHEPSSLFLATKNEGPAERIVGFAAYEANQGLGCFGPTGVDAECRGMGLGRRLLHATLADMKRLGRTDTQIGWVGPVDFYHRACGATLGPVFWAMRKPL